MTLGSSLSVLAALGFVLVLLGVALKFLRAFAPGASSRGRMRMRVVQRLSLGPKQGIAVVQIGRRHIAVTVGDGGVNRLFQLEEDEAAEFTAEVTGAPTSDKFVKSFATALKHASGLKAAALVALFAVMLSASSASAQAQARTAAPTAAAPKTAATKPVSAPATAAKKDTTTPAPALVSKSADLAITKLAPQVDLRVGGEANSGLRLSGTVGIVVMMGLLTLLPTLLLMMTSFTRILIVLHFLRTALATQNAPPATLVAAMALLLSGFVMQPTLTAVNRDALQPWMNGQIEQGEMLTRGAKPFRAFMLRQTRNHDLQVFVDLSRGPKPNTIDDVPLVTVMSAFVTSELRTSFQIGFALFLPFIVIDVVVSSVLMSMGMFMLPPAMISLPFKLLLFVLVDGWTLIVQSLVASFR